MSRWRVRVDTFLNSFRHWRVRTYHVVVHDFALGEKLSSALVLVLNTLVTGALIWYAVEHRNFLSYGIAAALITYWFTFAVETIRGRQKEK